jgi:hypothetical protein
VVLDSVSPPLETLSQLILPFFSRTFRPAVPTLANALAPCVHALIDPLTPVIEPFIRAIAPVVETLLDPVPSSVEPIAPFPVYVGQAGPRGDPQRRCQDNTIEVKTSHDFRSPFSRSSFPRYPFNR